MGLREGIHRQARFRFEGERVGRIINPGSLRGAAGYAFG